MQGRWLPHAKAMLFSAAVVGAGALMTFFFYDGPIRLPHMMPAAEATAEEMPPEDPAMPAAERTFSDTPPALNLPAGFTPRWERKALDSEIPVWLLKRKFALSQTKHQLGSEYFHYAASVFEQMADGIPDADLSARLQMLSMQVQTLGEAIGQSGDIRFDGIPSENLEHLRVRAMLESYLTDIQPALISASYASNGRLLKRETTPGAKTGQAVQTFSDTSQAILAHPLAKAYPDAMAIVRQESLLLKNLANNLALHWESTLYCRTSCHDTATRFRVYLGQNLPANAVALHYN